MQPWSRARRAPGQHPGEEKPNPKDTESSLGHVLAFHAPRAPGQHPGVEEKHIYLIYYA